MLFGIKIANYTYQWAMIKIFDELIHHQVGCYVNNPMVKIKEKEDHLYDLRAVFEWLC